MNVGASQATMFGTKVEIKLKKAEPGSWTHLEVPKMIAKHTTKQDALTEEIIPQVDAVDLSDL